MFESIAHVITVVADICVAIALGLNAWAFYKERRTTQVNIFNDFYKQAVEILDKKKDYEKDGKVFEWAITFLNHLEYLSILVNKGCLSFSFAEIYKPYVVKWYEEVVDRQLEDYLRETPEKFSEFKKLYLRLKES